MAFDKDLYGAEYKKSHYANMRIFVNKGKKQLIKERAEELGIPMTKLIFRALEQQYHIKFTDNN